MAESYRGGGGGGVGYRGGHGGGSRYSGGPGGGFTSGASSGFPSRGGRGGGRGGGPVGPSRMPESVRHQNLVSKPGNHGDIGQNVELIANYYKVDNIAVTVHHYDIQIDRNMPPDARRRPGGERLSSSSSSSGSSSSGGTDSSEEGNYLAKRYANEIVDRWIQQHGQRIRINRYIFDGSKNLYTVSLLQISDNEQADVQILLDGRPFDFILKIQYVQRLNLSEILEYYGHHRRAELSDRALSLFETLFRFIMGRHFEVFQRKFYDLQQVVGVNRTGMVEYMQGFTSAIRMAEFGIALNVHLKTSCMLHRGITRMDTFAQEYYQIVPGDISSSSSSSGGGEDEHLPRFFEISKMVRGLRCYTTHGGRRSTYVMDCVVPLTPYDYSFDRNGGGVISIAAYFQQMYNITCQKLPMIRTRGRFARYLPLELCYMLPHQFLSNAKINVEIQRELLLKSTHTPNVYFQKLEASVRRIATLEPELQRDFGVTLDTKPVAFTGRVLPTPRQLNSNPKDRFFKVEVKPKPLKWGIFAFDQQMTDGQLGIFVNNLIARARFYGIALERPYPVVAIPIMDMDFLENLLFRVGRMVKPDFMFFGIPATNPRGPPGPHIYARVKVFFDQRMDMLCQCFSVPKAHQQPAGYFDQFLLKTNAKLGGLNAVVSPETLDSFGSFPLKSTMFIGIDVNPVSEMNGVLSTAVAVVGSMDSMFTQYAVRLGVQRRYQVETVDHLDEWYIKRLLQSYQEANGKLPAAIVIFRAGVSDGEFNYVFQNESPLIMGAIADVVGRGNPQIPVTIFITQKHHNTRFALAQVNDRGRRPTWNVASGTVVDNTIVDPGERMFYLNSHFSPLGTSRPTKYTVIQDDNHLDANTLQRLVFLLCFNSARTRNVISLPTPVRYAELAAARIKLHLDSVKDEIDWSDLPAKENIEARVISRLNYIARVCPDVSEKLYFC